jgi:hypothetical protein
MRPFKAPFPRREPDRALRQGEEGLEQDDDTPRNEYGIRDSTPEDLRDPGSQVNAGAAWRWRIYILTPHTNGWQAKSMIPTMPVDAPVGFLWTRRKDIEGLKAYIDAALRSEASEVLRAQELGLAVDVKPGIPPGEDTYHVRADVLVDYLLLRGGIDLPAHGLLRLYTRQSANHNEQFITSDFLCALAPLLAKEDPVRRYPRDKEWFRVPPSKPALPTWLKVDHVTTAHHATHQANTEASEVDVEREVSRDVHSSYIEVITHVQPPEGRAYFCRRLLTFAGAVVYAATAWMQSGPWRVHQRDNAAIMALGIAI